MSISGFFQFIVGFILGTILFSTGILGGAYFFLAKMEVKPLKPEFSEEKPEKVEAKSSSSTNNNNSSSSTNNKSSSSTNNDNDNDLPPGAYRARVTWSTGLSLRSEPNKEAERIGGIGYNWEIIILKYNDNKQWQKVRIPSSGQEGWVKAGNVAKID